VDSRDQVRRLPRPGPSPGRCRQGVHPPGPDWTHRFKKIAADAWDINAGSAIIDGEVVAPADDGTTDFSVLQNELKGKSTRIVLVAFDLLYLNGCRARQQARTRRGRRQLDADLP
jgi:ATP-dependent DNA ligase